MNIYDAVTNVADHLSHMLSRIDQLEKYGDLKGEAIGNLQKRVRSLEGQGQGRLYVYKCGKCGACFEECQMVVKDRLHTHPTGCPRGLTPHWKLVDNTSATQQS